MNKIKFTSGTLQKISDSYYNLYLFNAGKQVYAATISMADACVILDKYANITLI